MPAASPSIVVITDSIDAHLPYVQKHLSEPLFVIDPQSLAQGCELTYETQGERLIVSHDNTTLDAVRSVWYRKPVDVKGDQLPVTGPLAHYALDAIHAHTRQLLSAFADARWVSNYYAIYRANNKTYQLQMAARVGFRIPRTCITSSPEKAQAFIKTAGGTLIVKPYASYTPRSKELPKSFLATKFTAQNPPQLDNLYLAPAIFQEAIEAACDVRVTVVGEKVFAARIRNVNQPEGSMVRDWRAGYYQGELHIEPYDNFPREIASRCVAHAKELGLLYSAIDLVEDAKGNFWFLENNPNGQWAFVEEDTGLPIGKAIADLLSIR